mmetsp:Transcript_23895/g.66308  ORF Transcript_23895/g.66308 Transcript_23895/m.66308 type:complete len:149 (+) Transcript_23895:767-1213(+)
MPPLRLTSMNHISRVCENVHRTKEFYETVLGFVEVRRPTQLEEDFEGSWLFNYGIGIHLIAGKPTCCPRELNPKDDHLSFQCESFTSIVDALEMDGIPYKRTVVRHQGMYEINQVGGLEVHDMLCRGRLRRPSFFNSGKATRPSSTSR